MRRMVYIRTKKIRGKTYYYVVEGKANKKGMVQQKVLLYLGNINHIIEVFNFYKKENKD